jgi:predicted Zn-dependent protease
MEKITYHTELNLPGITAEQASMAFDIAIGAWAEVCAIEPVRVDAQNIANIYARSGKGQAVNLDARGGTLAWSELPCGVEANVQLDQMFDEAEDWSFDMAVAVMCHELGHALGLPHLNQGNLMAPYYNPNVRAPQKGDIEEIVKLYGKRKRSAQKAHKSTQVAGTIMINGKPYMLVPQF